MQTAILRKSSVALCAVALSVFASASRAQQPPAAPNSPTPQATAGNPDETQPKRVLGMMPNFRSVTAGAVVQRETVRERFVMASQDNFDYSAFIFEGIIAGGSFLGKSTPEFHQGAGGFARYYWHTVADQSVENYFVEFIIPTVNHEDSRYFAMGREGGGPIRRTGYALSRAVVTRSETGKPMFNYAEILGAGMAASVSSLYYPGVERTAPNILRNWGLDVGYDAVTFLFHEFWPDISHALMPNRPRHNLESSR
jgi:hypothetical protein